MGTCRSSYLIRNSNRMRLFGELCDPVIGAPDKIWHTVRWQGRSDLRALWNKPVRIRFHLNESSLYAFQFIDSMSE